MSDEIQVLFEIRNMLIMKDTLTEMGIDYNEIKDDVVEIERQYHNIVINGKTGEISLDEENKRELDLITRNYKAAWYKDNLIRQGNRIEEEVTVTGEIIIHVKR